jgi:hypothetical protein
LYALADLWAVVGSLVGGELAMVVWMRLTGKMGFIGYIGYLISINNRK